MATGLGDGGVVEKFYVIKYLSRVCVEICEFDDEDLALETMDHLLDRKLSGEGEISVVLAVSENLQTLGMNPTYSLGAVLGEDYDDRF